MDMVSLVVVIMGMVSLVVVIMGMVSFVVVIMDMVSLVVVIMDMVSLVVVIMDMVSFVAFVAFVAFVHKRTHMAGCYSLCICRIVKYWEDLFCYVNSMLDRLWGSSLKDRIKAGYWLTY